MKERLKEIDEGRITGFFDKDTEIKGDLQFKGSFRIDGRFKGTIRSESILIIGDQGKVEADIQIGNIIINGEVKGNIHARERAEINSKGRVFGTITSPKLVVDEGAFLEAECHTSSKAPDPVSVTKKPELETKA